MLNPWEWLKWFYDAAGHKHPALSACGIVGGFALLGFLIWWRLDAQYTKEHLVPPPQAQTAAPPASSITITTEGDCSPVVTGSGSTVSSACEDSSKKASAKTKK
jgi:hypothetical protein